MVFIAILTQQQKALIIRRGRTLGELGTCPRKSVRRYLAHGRRLSRMAETPARQISGSLCCRIWTPPHSPRDWNTPQRDERRLPGDGKQSQRDKLSEESGILLGNRSLTVTSIQLLDECGRPIIQLALASPQSHPLDMGVRPVIADDERLARQRVLILLESEPQV